MFCTLFSDSLIIGNSEGRQMSYSERCLFGVKQVVSFQKWKSLISSANTILLPCEHLVPKSARCLHRVKMFGEVQIPCSTNATLFRSSLCDISSMKHVLGLDSIAVCLRSPTLFLQFSENMTFSKFYQRKEIYIGIIRRIMNLNIMKT